MKIFKVKNVKTPTRANSTDAGIDFFVPEADSLYLKEPNSGKLYGPLTEIKLRPNQSALIPSGIKAKVPEGYALIAFNKSGVATKKGLIHGAGVVDEGYQGEIHIHVINVGNMEVTIAPGEKLLQFSLIAQNYDVVEEVSSENELFESLVSERGAGGFGSTGTH